MPFALHLAIGALLAAAASWLLLDRLARRHRIDSLRHRLLKRCRLSVGSTLLIAGLSWWLLALLGQLGWNPPRSGEQVRDALITLGLMWTLLRCKGVLLAHMQSHQHLWPSGDSNTAYLIDLTNKLLTTAVVLIGVVESLQLLGVSPGVLFAASGFGAAAIGFGARTLIENLLSGVMLYINRPFVVGDLISIPDLSLSGTVSSIGMYYSKLITQDRQPLYLPNAAFASHAVINTQRREHRELLLNFSLRCSDHTRVNAITGELRKTLAHTEGVDTALPMRVHCTGLVNSCLNLRMQCFCGGDPEAALDLQQKLLLLIAAVVEGHGAAMPAPIATISATPDGADRP